MDFFLGSGTTTAVAHKLKRKWIGVEMGEHFYTIVLPRMKKVLAYDKSGISKEKDVKEKYNEKTAGGFFKYQILEQYDDSLDNIELTENHEARLIFKDDYLIKYFLDYETRDNPVFLNLENLRHPFEYKLKINLHEVGSPEEMRVDLPETFNYLLGVKVKKIILRYKDELPYLFTLAEKENAPCVIIWRDVPDSFTPADFNADRQFIEDFLSNLNFKPTFVYINSPSTLTDTLPNGTRFNLFYIEPIFKKLMMEA